MNQALQAAPTVTDEQLALVKRTVANGATDAELQLFLHDCARRQIHPLDKLLHFTKRGGKYTPITSIDFMRSQAAVTGEYAGNDDPVFQGTTEDGPPSEAKVTVYRIVQGTRCPFSATARWTEYFPGDRSGGMWKKMPHTMLGKCAESLALRKGFPQQLAGLYSSEEMDQAGGNAYAPVLSGTEADAPMAVNKQGGATLPAPPAGTVRIEVVTERKTKAGKPYWPITDSNGEFSVIWHKNKRESDGEWVEGADLAALAKAVAESGEAVVIETQPTGKDGDKLALVQISRHTDDGANTEAGRAQDIQESMGDISPVVDSIAF